MPFFLLKMRKKSKVHESSQAYPVVSSLPTPTRYSVPKTKGRKVRGRRAARTVHFIIMGYREKSKER
jgi:hypothetical protein